MLLLVVLVEHTLGHGGGNKKKETVTYDVAGDKTH
jgi:hypothetical protein